MDHYIKPLLEYRKLIAVVTLLTALAGIAAWIVLPTKYEATTSVLLTPISADPLAQLESGGKADVDLTTELLIATSTAVTNLAAEDLAAQSISISASQLASQASANSPRNSKVLEITFEASTPQLARIGADTIARNYLLYRAGIAADNRSDAVDALNERVTLLKENLANVESEISRTLPDAQPQVALTVERDSLLAELTAQQDALAALSTLNVDAGEILDPAGLPTNPAGIGLLPILVGAVVGGLLMGAVLAMLVSAIKASSTPRNRRASDRIEYNRRQEDRHFGSGRRVSDRSGGGGGGAMTAVERLEAVTQTATPSHPSDPNTNPNSEADDSERPPVAPTPASADPEIAPLTEAMTVPDQPKTETPTGTEFPDTVPTADATVDIDPVKNDTFSRPADTMLSRNEVAAPASDSTNGTVPSGFDLDVIPPAPPRPPNLVDNGSIPPPPLKPNTKRTVSDPIGTPLPPGGGANGADAYVPPPPPPPGKKSPASGRTGGSGPATMAAVDTMQNATAVATLAPQAAAAASEPMQPNTKPAPDVLNVPADLTRPTQTLSPFPLPAEKTFARLNRVLSKRQSPAALLSVAEQDRATAVAAAFAFIDTLRLADQKVLIIDAMLNEPHLKQILGLAEGPGLSDVLLGQATLESVIQPVADIDQIHAVPTGQPNALAQSALSTQMMRRVVGAAKRRYAMTIMVVGHLDDAAMITRAGDSIDGVLTSTNEPAGHQATGSLAVMLRDMPAPVLARISVPDLSDADVDDAATGR